MKERVKLLDCTLGMGGEAVFWRFGEDQIPSMLSLLQRSRFEIVEYGVLCKYTKGPHCSVYTSTLLPPFLEKKADQSYALLLDPEGIYPDYSNLPEQGDRTVDIIRVIVTQKRFEKDLANCRALKEKGYRVYVLLEETAQYEADELKQLLCRIEKVKPAACFICDSLGVLSEKELEDILELFQELLSPQIGIGFDGKNNFGRVLDLGKAFCQHPAERDMILNASIGGIALGQTRLPSAEIADWMNKEYGASYDKCVLDFVETYLGNDLSSKHDSRSVLLYRACAENRCSYEYVDYYTNLGVEPYVQLEVLEEIEPRKAMFFDKHEANRALQHFRKKRLNLLIAVPTADHPEAIEHLLYTSAADLLKFGVDLLIYDSSEDERTHATTKNYQIEGDDNVIYERCVATKGALSDEAMISLFRRYRDYEYIWVIRDGWIPSLPLFYNEFLVFVEKQADVVVLDWSGRNKGRRSSKSYTDCLSFFAENAVRVKRPGCLVFSGAFVKKLLENRVSGEEYYGFWLPAAAFRQLAEEPANTGLLMSYVFFLNPKLSPSDGSDDQMIEHWGEDWRRVISELPAVYDPAKSCVLRAYTEDFRPFSVKSMLALRARGAYNLSVFRQKKALFSEVSDNSQFNFFVTAISSRGLAKLSVRLNRYGQEHADSRFSRFMDKVRSIYVRIRR